MILAAIVGIVLLFILGYVFGTVARDAMMGTPAPAAKQAAAPAAKPAAKPAGAPAKPARTSGKKAPARSSGKKAPARRGAAKSKKKSS